MGSFHKLSKTSNILLRIPQAGLQLRIQAQAILLSQPSLLPTQSSRNGEPFRLILQKSCIQKCLPGTPFQQTCRIRPCSSCLNYIFFFFFSLLCLIVSSLISSPLTFFLPISFSNFDVIFSNSTSHSSCTLLTTFLASRSRCSINCLYSLSSSSLCLASNSTCSSRSR